MHLLKTHLPRRSTFGPLLRHRLGPSVSDDTAGQGSGIFAGTVLSRACIVHVRVGSSPPHGIKAFGAQETPRIGMAASFIGLAD